MSTTTVCNCIGFWQRLGKVMLMGVVACAPPATMAAEFCVGTIAEFDDALGYATSAAAASDTTIIRIKQGTYDLSINNLLRYNNTFHAMQWLGGYNADCSLRTLAPANTVFDAKGVTINGQGMLGNLLVEGLTFKGFGGAHTLDISTEAPNIELDFYNNILQGAKFNLVADNYENASSSGTVARLRNNLVSGNANVLPIMAIYVAGFQGAVSLTSNTVANNATNGIFLCSNEGVLLKDNIAWGNSGTDISVVDCGDYSSTEDVEMHGNLYGSLFANVTNPGSADSSTSDPLFVNAAAGNFHLQNASPAINSGYMTSSLTGVDLDSSPRVVGSLVDRGAYESSIDDTIPTTITVTNANDQGAGSLRQAILDANANPDFTFINFNISGTCPILIAPDSADLPAITHGVRIDGYSQPGSKANSASKGDNATRCIELSGKYGLANGLAFAGPSSDQFWVQGMIFTGFSSNALRLDGGTGSLVWGNQFGGRLNGATLPANTNNIRLTSASSGTQVGGDSPALRNVIDGASGGGVIIAGSSNNNAVIGNLIGTWGSETGVLVGNGTGVLIITGGNTVRNNVIVGSGGDGIYIATSAAHGNLVEYNRIGRTDTTCVLFPTPFCYNDNAPNAEHGVRIESGAHDNTVQNNTIWYNTQMGISVSGNVKGNKLSANSIYSNGSYGIDLEGSGLNDNDSAAGAANLPNRGLNYPQITSAVGGSRNGVITGTLSSINDLYVIQIFSSAAADNVPNGEGEVFHRSGIAFISNATSGVDGMASYRIAFSSPTVSLAGRSMALTAIDSSGNTSEFSFSVPYNCDVIFRNGLDDGYGDQCPKP